MKPNPYSPPVHVEAPAASFAAEAPPSWMVSFRWIAAAGGIAMCVGIVDRAVRPLIPGTIHYDAIVGLGLMLVLCIILLVRFWRFPKFRGALSYGIGTVTVWAGHWLGWTIVHGSVWYDVLQVHMAYGAIVAVGGCLVMFVPHRRVPSSSFRSR